MGTFRFIEKLNKILLDGDKHKPCDINHELRNILSNRIVKITNVNIEEQRTQH